MTSGASKKETQREMNMRELESLKGKETKGGLGEGSTLPESMTKFVGAEEEDDVTGLDAGAPRLTPSM